MSEYDRDGCYKCPKMATYQGHWKYCDDCIVNVYEILSTRTNCECRNVASKTCRSLQGFKNHQLFDWMKGGLRSFVVYVHGHLHLLETCSACSPRQIKIQRKEDSIRSTIKDIETLETAVDQPFRRDLIQQEVHAQLTRIKKNEAEIGYHQRSIKSTEQIITSLKAALEEQYASIKAHQSEMEFQQQASKDKLRKIEQLQETLKVLPPESKQAIFGKIKSLKRKHEIVCDQLDKLNELQPVYQYDRMNVSERRQFLEEGRKRRRTISNPRYYDSQTSVQDVCDKDKELEEKVDQLLQEARNIVEHL